MTIQLLRLAYILRRLTLRKPRQLKRHVRV